MAGPFEFQVEYRYDTRKPGIEIPVQLVGGDKSADVDARLDTGSTYCVFERHYAELLDLNVEQGIPDWVWTANGQFKVFGHWVTIACLGFEVDSLVYFAADESIRRNVLGRQGWIDRFRLCLIEHDGGLYLSHYDEAQGA